MSAEEQLELEDRTRGANAPEQTDIWIEPHNRWKAIGLLHADGSMTGVTVEDLNQIARGRNLEFSSVLDFIAWVRRNAQVAAC